MLANSEAHAILLPIILIFSTEIDELSAFLTIKDKDIKISSELVHNSEVGSTSETKSRIHHK